MKIFVHQTTEFQLLHVFLHEYISLPFQLELNEFEENYFCFVIDNKIAALGKNTLFKKQADNEYQYTMDIHHITKPDARALFSFQTNNSFLKKEDEQTLISIIEKTPYDFQYFMMNSEELFQKEALQIKKNLKQSKQVVPTKTKQEKNKNSYTNISEPHLKAQYILKEIADILELDAFIAKNDQSKIFKNEKLSTSTLLQFPEFKLSKDLTKHLSLIDTIWFKNETYPFAAFEVETSTSVYSGILRMADLLCSIGSENINLYIVTTRERENKIKKELNRPIFKRIGLSQIVKVIYIDDLEKLYDMIKLLKGHIKETVLEKISFSYEDFRIEEACAN